jgi:hypothetical protein
MPHWPAGSHHRRHEPQGLESPGHEDGQRRPKRPAVRKNHSRETADPDQRGSAPCTSASVVATASRMSARDKNSGLLALLHLQWRITRNAS